MDMRGKLYRLCYYVSARPLTVVAVLALAGGLVMAQSTSLNATAGLQSLCQTIKSVVPLLAFLMFLMAGLIYAGGQVMGAETRARANVWSTAMLVGGIIGLLIASIAGYLVNWFAGIGGSLSAGSIAC